MSSRYYNLLVKEKAGWEWQFGSYDVDEVEQEMRAVQSAVGLHKVWCQIVTTSSKDAPIQATIDKMNEAA